MMKVCIITTVYNAAEDLPRLLNSMMAQKSSELEFFLIDNGSTDNSRSICEEYAKLDNRFKIFIIKENVGYICARNIGIKEVTADYIGFCDSDDFLVEGAYDRAIEKINETHCDLYLTSYRTIQGEKIVENKLPYAVGCYKGVDIKEKVLPLAFGPYKEKAMLHGFMWKEIFRHDLLLTNNLTFDAELKPYEDQLLNVQAISLCNKIFVDDNPIYNYIVNPKSITAQDIKGTDFSKDWNRIVTLYNKKNNYVNDHKTKTSNANATFNFIYAMVLKIIKYDSNPKQTLLTLLDDDFIGKILTDVNMKKNKSLAFVFFCLKHHHITALCYIIKNMLKVKKYA